MEELVKIVLNSLIAQGPLVIVLFLYSVALSYFVYKLVDKIFSVVQTNTEINTKLVEKIDALGKKN